MEENLEIVLKAFCSSVEKYIDFIPCDDPKFIRYDGILKLEDKMIPVLKSGATELGEYKDLTSTLLDIKTFKYSLSKIGRWCTVNNLIEWMILKSAIIEKEQVIINTDLARSYLENFRDTLDSKSVNYKLSERILGLVLTIDKIELDEGVSIVRLNDEELNRQMPRISTLDMGMPYIDLTAHPVEVRCTVSQKTKKIKYDILRAKSDVKEELLNMKNDVFSSILLTKRGTIEHGPYSIKLKGVNGEELTDDEDTILSHDTGLVFRHKIVIAEEDVEKLKNSFMLARKISLENDVLQAALERFVLGTKRLNIKDRLVDYVIAWEALLLTVEGRAGKSELTYRFAINGSSLLYWMSDGLISREDGFTFMKGLYSCRSMMVHGAGKKNLSKELEKINYETLDDLTEKVGDYLRQAILWLAAIEEMKRPYKQTWGWEKLMWTDFKN